MRDFLADFRNIRENISDYLQAIRLRDLFDIVLVTIIFMMLFRFFRNRRAGKLAVGVLTLVLVQVFSDLLGLAAVSYLMQFVWQVGFVALLVIFQPELRSFLEELGNGSIHSLRSITDPHAAEQTSVQQIAAICTAVCDMAKEKTGALIVLGRHTQLGEITQSGTLLHADLSPFLLRNIFFDKSPLHDGAVVIQNGRVVAAGCFLPLSAKNDIVRDLGTRHRAAIGMSENSDAVVIVVSEETGCISVACGGELKRNFGYSSLQHELEEKLHTERPRKFSIRGHRSEGGKKK